MKKWLVISLLAAGMSLLVLPAQAQTPAVEAGPIALHTFGGETLGGLCLGLHVIPAGTNKWQGWASRHLTLDLLTTGTSIGDITKVGLGTSLNLAAPEGRLKLGITYLWQERVGAVYIGYAFPIK